MAVLASASPPQRLALRLPRALLDPARPDLACGDGDGLLAVELQIAAGRIAAIRPLPPGQMPLPLAITPPLDAHVHLDKAFSWAEGFANRGGTMAGAMAANLQEGQQRSEEQVLLRGERALDQAWRYGLRGLRSHIDSGAACSEPSWRALLELQQRWRDRLALQLVALAPLDQWGSADGLALARRVAAADGLLGGVLGPPFPRAGRDRQALQQLLQLAAELGCGIDLHIDEAGDSPGSGVRLLLELLEQWRPPVPITCSHACSMALLPLPARQRLAERLAALEVSVVALPTTNAWLLGREGEFTAPQRPLAPLQVLQQAGVAVAIGADNVQDPWYPGNDFDPLELLRLACRATHCPPWQRQGLMPFVQVPARLLQLPWDGIVRVGAPADLLITGASSWSELLARPPQRRVLRQARATRPRKSSPPRRICAS